MGSFERLYICASKRFGPPPSRVRPPQGRRALKIERLPQKPWLGGGRKTPVYQTSPAQHWYICAPYLCTVLPLTQSPTTPSPPSRTRRTPPREPRPLTDGRARTRRGNEGIIFPHSLARPWRGPMALPRDGSVFFGRVFDIVDTPDRCVNNTASVVVSSTSTGSGNMRAPPLCKKQGEMRHAGV